MASKIRVAPDIGLFENAAETMVQGGTTIAERQRIPQRSAGEVFDMPRLPARSPCQPKIRIIID
jgi:hypothetical protein